MKGSSLWILLALFLLTTRGGLIFTCYHDRRPHASFVSPGGPGDAGSERRANHLINARSPYLLHHAYNPVDWHPWGEEAFKKARNENRVIFCSVGYSACHWCLVMERESFQSQRVAEILNEKFVSIKVDREERPDVDAMLIRFLEQASGSAGWPMNVFLTPDLKPFTGGTYFPEERFVSILERIAEAWRDKPEEVQGQGDRVVQAFRRQLGSEASSPLAGEEAELLRVSGQVRDKAVEHLMEEFDATHGGFGRSLKFPRPSVLNFLFREHFANPRHGGEALHMALTTLVKMAQGGIRDYIGGGFHRYSTDARWHVPHFEKMIYDQTQLINSYVEAFQVTGDGVFEDVARDTIAYLLRDMMSPEGGFYSAESAESPPPAAREGAFYVWTREEIAQALAEGGVKGDEEARLCQLLGVKEGGNVLAANDPHGELTDQNVLFLTKPLGELSEEEKEVLRKGRKALMKAREGRPRPERDEKVVAGWNGMVIGSLSRASRVLADPSYLSAAERTANHIRQSLYDEQTGELLRLSFRGLPSNVKAMAEDYAYLIRGLIDLYEASGKTDYFRWARRLQETMDEAFLCRGGEEGEGYLQGRREDFSMSYLVKSTYDGAEPSATSVAVHNLLRLAALTDDDRLYKQAERIIGAVLLDPSAPFAAPELLSSMLLYGNSLREIIITGKQGAPDTVALLQVVNRLFLPDSVLIIRSDSDEDQDLSLYSPTVRMCGLVQGKAAARTCQARVCSPAIISADTLTERLSMPRRGSL